MIKFLNSRMTGNTGFFMGSAVALAFYVWFCLVMPGCGNPNCDTVEDTSGEIEYYVCDNEDDAYLRVATPKPTPTVVPDVEGL